VHIMVKGVGGHAARPHMSVDSTVVASQILLLLQTIVSREIDPTRPSVVTVGSIHGGTKHNIIPNEVKLQLTLRAYRDDVRDRLIDGIKRRINGLAQAHNAPAPLFETAESTPPTINTPALVERILPAFKKALGADHVKPVDPVMGAEDFGLFGKGGVPTFMFRVGTIPPARIAAAEAKGETLPSLHSASYAPEPSESVRIGIRAMTTAVVELMRPGAKKP
jgi:amidohydrolase